MSGTGRRGTVAWGLALALSLCATGCPGGGGAQRASQLKLRYDEGSAAPEALAVGKRVQLHLQFAGDTGQLMVGALIDAPPDQVTTWHAEPADAVRFAQDTAQVEFLRAGTVKVWATYRDGDQELTSNPLTFEVKASDVVAPGGEPAPVSPRQPPKAN